MALKSKHLEAKSNIKFNNIKNRKFRNNVLNTADEIYAWYRTTLVFRMFQHFINRFTEMKLIYNILCQNKRTGVVIPR